MPHLIPSDKENKWGKLGPFLQAIFILLAEWKWHGNIGFHNQQPQSSLRNIFWSWKPVQNISLPRLTRVPGA